MNINIVRVAGLLIAVAGLALLLATPGMTESTAWSILQRHGGGMDTNALNLQVQMALDSYRAIGAVALAVGLFRLTQPDRG